MLHISVISPESLLYEGDAPSVVAPAPAVWTIGLRGQFSHGPAIDRERATITMWLVGGPAVPP